MRYGGLFGDGDAGPITVIRPAPGEQSVELPSGDLLMSAEYARVGSDLLLKGADGTQVLVEGYFAAEQAPDLVAEGGYTIWPDPSSLSLNVPPLTVMPSRTWTSVRLRVRCEKIS